MANLKQEIKRLEDLLLSTVAKSIKYDYYRPVKYYWLPTKNPNVMYRHATESQYGGSTTIGIIHKINNEWYSVAVRCHSKDLFVKDKGRVLALARLCEKLGIGTRG